MPYALLDEDFHSNPKMLALGNDGTGLYARGLSYCAHYQTDGFIPHSWANAAAENRRSLLAKLVDQLAWVPLAKGETFTTTDRSDNTVIVTAARERGYIVSDYFDYNPSSAEREAASAKKAAAGRAGATRRWGRGSRHSTSHSNGIAGAIAGGMANGWQNDGTPRARPPSPISKEEGFALDVARAPALQRLVAAAGGGSEATAKIARSLGFPPPSTDELEHVIRCATGDNVRDPLAVTLSELSKLSRAKSA